MAVQKKKPVPATRKNVVQKPAPRSVQKPAPKKLAPVNRQTRFDDMVEDNGEEIFDVEAAETMPRNALTVYSDKPQLDGGDLFIPRLRLAQGLTAEVQSGDAKPGQWLVLGNDPFEEVNVIPVAMTRRRELRDPDTRSVVCRSPDGFTGIGNPGGDCSTCEMAEWQQSSKKGGKNLPPPCSFSYSYMVYVVEAETLAILDFSRTSITAGKMLNTMIAQHGIGAFAVRLASNKKSGPQGTFYSPTVNQAVADPDIIKQALAESSAMR